MEVPLPLSVGRYELLERVGNGSLGTLYRGRDTLLGRDVAVKVMAAGLLGDDSAHARFFREAKAAAKLQHINIVTIFEFGQHDDTPYIVTEFLRGDSLDKRLTQEPPMSLHDKLDLGIQLCAGLEAAHTQGMVHRDVKPANIWICLDGTLKLLDFGIANAASSAATFTDVLSNPGYMSPEQIAGKGVDSRTDIFSAGVVLYELLSGRHPFEADSPTAVMMRILNDGAEPIADDELPPALTSAVLRAMEKSPDARYARAAELGRDLKAVKADLPVAAEPATLFIERTVVHIPPPPVVREPLGARLRALLPAFPRIPAFRGIQLGRPPLAMVVLLIALAAGILAWFVWSSGQESVPPVVSNQTPGVDPEQTPPPAQTTKPRPDVHLPTPVALLRVASQPSGARILLDGVDSGQTTPADIKIDPSRLPTTVQFELQGFSPESVNVTPESLRSGSIDVALTRRDTRVVLVATGEYEFEVMDRQKVLSPASRRHDVVVTGLQSVRLHSHRYFLDEPVPVNRGTSKVTASAPPLGTITVHASGPLEECRVSIDGVDAGPQPLSSRPIVIGAHRVKLVCRGGDTDPDTVYVTANKNTQTRFPANRPVRPR
jgi:serine/threonine-protein kinase